MHSINKSGFARYLIFLAAFLILATLQLSGQDPTPDAPVFNWKLILLVVIGVYDVIVRIFPTVNDLSWLSWIIKLISFLNEFLNRKKRK